MLQRRIVTVAIFALYSVGFWLNTWTTHGLASWCMFISGVLIFCYLPGYWITTICLSNAELQRYEHIGISLLLSLTLCLLVILYLLVLHISLSSAHVLASLGFCVLVAGILELLLKLRYPTV